MLCTDLTGNIIFSPIMANLREISMSHVIHPNFLRDSEDTYIRGVVLIAKRNDRPLQTYRPNVGKLRKTSIDSAYDRMIIIGEVQTSGCFAIITSNTQESSTIFRNPQISVGSIVLVHEPIFTGVCLGNDKSNPIFEVRRSLELQNDNGIILPPFAIIANPLTTALTKFQLNNVRLSFIHALIAAPTCGGVFCDRKSIKTGNCACIQKSALSSWALSCRIFSADVDNLIDDPLSGEVMQSLQLSKIFCCVGTLALPAADIQLPNLRNAVRNIQRHVNDNGGWVVTGFFKSGMSDENIAQSISRIQICRIKPTVLIPDNLKYNAAGNNENPDPLPPLQPAAQA